MSDGGHKKRKSKGWYRKQAYCNKRMKGDGRPGHRLVAGLKGFIITCNDHERDAVKESYNILNEYADKLYGPETKAEENASSDSDGDDIEAAIAKEVQNLKDAATTGERRFQNSQTGAKNCIFIKTTLDDPVGLAHAIFSDLAETKVQKSRHALRLLPVVGTCQANLKDMAKLAEVALTPYFTDTEAEVTYSINFKARNNKSIGREMTISTLRDTISENFSSAVLSHVNPQVSIMVEVMCGTACFAVARDYSRFRKYNLVEIVCDRQTPTAMKVAEESIVKTERTSTVEMDEARSGMSETTDHQVQETSETEGKADSNVDCVAAVSTNIQEQDAECETHASTNPENKCAEGSGEEHNAPLSTNIQAQDAECETHATAKLENKCAEGSGEEHSTPLSTNIQAQDAECETHATAKLENKCAEGSRKEHRAPVSTNIQAPDVKCETHAAANLENNCIKGSGEGDSAGLHQLVSEEN